MKRKRFSEEKIIGVLKEHEAGAKTDDICCRHGVGTATFYNWRKKYGGMEVSDAKKLSSLEAENAKLKKLLAESVMDLSTLKEMLGKTSDARVEEERGGDAVHIHHRARRGCRQHMGGVSGCLGDLGHGRRRWRARGLGRTGRQQQREQGSTGGHRHRTPRWRRGGT